MIFIYRLNFMTLSIDLKRTPLETLIEKGEKIILFLENKDKYTLKNKELF